MSIGSCSKCPSKPAIRIYEARDPCLSGAAVTVYRSPRRVSIDARGEHLSKLAASIYREPATVYKLLKPQQFNYSFYEPAPRSHLQYTVRPLRPPGDSPQSRRPSTAHADLARSVAPHLGADASIAAHPCTAAGESETLVVSEFLIFHVLWACIVLRVNTYYTNWWETNTANQLITNLIACLIMVVFFLVA